MSAKGEGATLRVLPSSKIFRKVHQLIDGIVVKLLKRYEMSHLVRTPQNPQHLGSRSDMVVNAPILVDVDCNELLKGYNGVPKHFGRALAHPALDHVPLLLREAVDGRAELLEYGIVVLWLHQAGEEQHDDKQSERLKLVRRSLRRDYRPSAQILESCSYHIRERAVRELPPGIYNCKRPLPRLEHGGIGLSDGVAVDPRLMLRCP
mmetsp:Transcript_38557/g.98566  ORF Transcript_38557/g.98566 Transcript_38557/m.98566 type:complete len:206 (-) Transcript_38557:632-1249(-)